MKIVALKARPQWAAKIVVGTLVFGAAWGAQAQQDQGGMGQGGPGQGGRRNFQNMTPADRQALQAQMEERRNTQRQEWLRQAITASGVTDVVAQNSILNLMTAQEKSKVALQQQARALATLLTQPETSDVTLKTDLAAYRAAVAAADKQNSDGLAALDAQVKYSTNPRVETLLTLLGVLGNETVKLGGIGEVFPDSPYANRGGFGGGRGGRGGGQGGRQGGGQQGGRGGFDGGQGGGPQG
ncbi:hypothetical protein B1R32_11666 [Abditibacterium utsteinense]|uniref:Heavy-metal resistance n=1 Tax=Abditibacterium utsteinense TaxID=1960156 RepID=A0A2S8SQR6_9BACT|nr:hypothetical protein [Abditibacterium utsteinense]PQV63089.1 hypothetical protein B1R32_11666 [Abditibacterium utsteinense]